MAALGSGGEMEGGKTSAKQASAETSTSLKPVSAIERDTQKRNEKRTMQ